MKPKYDNYDVNDTSFAKIAFDYVQELQKNKGYSYNRLKLSLNCLIRTWTDKPHKIISKKVAEHFTQNYPNINPFLVRWDNRKKYGIIGSKSILVLEHTTPVSIFIKQLIKCKSLQEVITSMNEYTGVCLITRDEDDLLNLKGYRSKRPNGWEQSYKECGIEIIKLKL